MQARRFLIIGYRYGLGPALAEHMHAAYPSYSIAYFGAEAPKTPAILSQSSWDPVDFIDLLDIQTEIIYLDIESDYAPIRRDRTDRANRKRLDACLDACLAYGCQSWWTISPGLLQEHVELLQSAGRIHQLPDIALSWRYAEIQTARLRIEGLDAEMIHLPLLINHSSSLSVSRQGIPVLTLESACIQLCDRIPAETELRADYQIRLEEYQDHGLEMQPSDRPLSWSDRIRSIGIASDFMDWGK